MATRTSKKKQVSRKLNKNNSTRAVHFFVHFCFQHSLQFFTTTTWNYLISCFTEDVTTRHVFFLSFSELKSVQPFWLQKNCPAFDKSNEVENLLFNFRVFYTKEKSLIHRPLADVICYVTWATSSPGSSRFPIWRRQERRPWHTAN